MVKKMLYDLIAIKEINNPWQYFGSKEMHFMYSFVRTSRNTSCKLISQIRRFANNLNLPPYVVARVILINEKFSDILIR